VSGLRQPVDGKTMNSDGKYRNKRVAENLDLEMKKMSLLLGILKNPLDI
jgi:hypothetical protein